MIYLYEKLSPEDREGRLECLLIAAPLGGGAMLKVLEQLMLCHSVEELLEEHTS